MLKTALVDYNPVAQLINANLPKSSLISDLSDYLRSLLFNKPDSNLQKILFLLGITTLTLKSLHLLHNTISNWSWLPKYFTFSSQLSKQRLKQVYGDTFVMITGFTQGIGHGYAQIFAEYGFNLLLVGRNHQNVENKVNELKKSYRGIRIQHFVCDFASTHDHQLIESSLNMFKDIDIGIVINNAGSVASGYYETVDEKEIVNDINADLYAIFIINRLMIPRLRARPMRSAILNISSATGYRLAGRVGVYSAIKLTLDHYSRILSLENSDKIDVISLRALGVSTKMMKFKKGPFMVSPRSFARSSLVDLLAGETESFGHPRHKLMNSLMFARLNQKQTFQLFDALWDKASLKTRHVKK